MSNTLVRFGKENSKYISWREALTPQMQRHNQSFSFIILPLGRRLWIQVLHAEERNSTQRNVLNHGQWKAGR